MHVSFNQKVVSAIRNIVVIRYVLTRLQRNRIIEPEVVVFKYVGLEISLDFKSYETRSLVLERKVKQANWPLGIAVENPHQISLVFVQTLGSNLDCLYH